MDWTALAICSLIFSIPLYALKRRFDLREKQLEAGLATPAAMLALRAENDSLRQRLDTLEGALTSSSDSALLARFAALESSDTMSLPAAAGSNVALPARK